MPHLYLNNDSYPELRDIQPRWVRTLTWWRAITRAAGHADFWIFAATQIGLLGCFVLLDVVTVVAADLEPGRSRIVHIVFGVCALGVFSYLQVSWGGDMMRRHLRAVSEVARYACPGCGHSLFGHLGQGQGSIRCPECGSEIDRDTFAPPYRVPARFRAFPPWRRR